MPKSSLLRTKLLSEIDIRKMETETKSMENLGFFKPAEIKPRPISVVLEYLKVHKNGILGGSLTRADLRLDVVVSHANKEENANFYTIDTIPYKNVADGDELVREFENKLLFSGNAKYFLNFQIMLSRDKPDSKSLKDLLTDDMLKNTIPDSFDSIFSLINAINPTAAIIGGAINGAITIGRLAWDILDNHTDKTIFSYDNVWFQNRNNFGIGRHPEKDTQIIDDGEIYFSVFEGF